MKRASSSKLHQLQSWIRGIKVAMLTTEDRNGRLHSRPMVVLDDYSEDALWFFSDACSHKVDDIHGHRPVNLTYCDSARNLFLSVSGRAQVVRDRARMKALWQRGLEQWFPKGAEDPEVVLLRIEIQEAEVWHAPERLIEVEFAATNASTHEMVTFA